MDSMPPIRYSTYIKAPPARVYAALTTGPGWQSWFATRAQIDLQARRYHFHWENFGGERTTLTLEGPVLQAVPERIFSFQWGSGGGMTTVSFRLEPHGEGTRVQVEETGYSTEKSDVIACLDCACGWGEALTLLKFYLEHGLTYGPVPE